MEAPLFELRSPPFEGGLGALTLHNHRLVYKLSMIEQKLPAAHQPPEHILDDLCLARPPRLAAAMPGDAAARSRSGNATGMPGIARRCSDALDIPCAAQPEQLVEPIARRVQFLVERGAVGKVQHLNHGRLVGSLAFANDPARIAAERLEEVVFDRGVVELDGPRSQRVEVGLLPVGARERRSSRTGSGPR